MGIKFPEVVVEQIFLESGWLKSSRFKKSNNPLGFKCDSERIFCDSIYLGHAYYNTIREAFVQYKGWQVEAIHYHQIRYNKKIETKEDYYYMLNHVVLANTPANVVWRYAEDPKYTEKLRLIRKRINKFINYNHKQYVRNYCISCRLQYIGLLGLFRSE